MNKYIILSSTNSKYLAYLNILQSFYISGDDITLIFPDEIASSFKKGTNYEKLGINRVDVYKRQALNTVVKYAAALGITPKVLPATDQSSLFFIDFEAR